MENILQEGCMKKIVLSLFLTVLCAAALFAFDGYVIVTNDTGYDIFYLYVSHTDASDWGDDVLGNQVLSDGDSFRIDLEDYPSSIFDIHAEDVDGDTYTRWSVDVEVEDVTLTLSDLD